MSIHKRSNGTFQVRWREHGRQRSRGFARKGDAEQFDLEVRRRLQLGPVLGRTRDLDRGPLTLRAFVHTGFRGYAATLAPATRNQYAWALEHHLAELADRPLITFDVPALAEHQAHLLEHGRSANTVREVMTRLSGILQVAVEHGHLPANPVRSLRKVPAEPREEVRPLTPTELEAVIAAFTGRSRAITVLAGYFGLRPLEIRLAPWRALDSDQLTVSRARTKRSAARTRVITGPHAGIGELKRWRLESGRPGPDQPIIGGETKSTLVQWTWKHLTPTVERVTGRSGVTLYTLRHTHASMLHYCGWTVPAAAKRLGHTGQVHLGIYAHVIDALEGRPHYADLDALITAAREPAVPSVFPKI